jgi:hypothetical protein
MKVLQTYIYLDQLQTESNQSVLFEAPVVINIYNHAKYFLK